MKKMKKIIKTILLLFLILQPIQQMTAISSKATPTTNIHAPRAITSPTPINEVFPDPTLAEIIRENVGKASVTDTITQIDLDTITSLYGTPGSIISIEGVQHLTNLINLSLYYNQITDISPLTSANLPELIYLELYNNQITDISALRTANLPVLRTIDLSNNPITDISPLTSANLPELSYLVLSNNPITDISALGTANLPELSYLVLSNNPITDISALGTANFPSLTTLDLNNNQITDMSALGTANFPSLTTLDLNNNQITDMSALGTANFPSLTTLDLNNNQITDMSALGIANLPSLTTLDLSDNQITDISALGIANLPSLTTLDLSDNQISDISALGTANFPVLSSLSIGSQQLLLKEQLWNETMTIPYNVLDENGQVIMPTSSYFWDGAEEFEPTYGQSQLTMTFSNSNPELEIPLVDFIVEKDITIGNITVPFGLYYMVILDARATYFIDNEVYEAETVSFNYESDWVSFLNKPLDPTKDGYKFIGWNTSADGTGQMWDFESNKMSHYKLNLYAQWELLDTSSGSGDHVDEINTLPVGENNNNSHLVTTGQSSLAHVAVGSMLSLIGMLVVFIAKRYH